MSDQSASSAGERRSTGGGARAATVQHVVYLHGFLSSGVSTKARFFRRQFELLDAAAFHAIEFNPTPRDFETMTLTGQINRLRQYLLDRELVELGAGQGRRLTSLIGSSFGGWVALHYAHRFGGVERLVLLAPALVGLTEIVSPEEVRRWEEAGRAPIFHPAFGREVPVRYDLHADSLRYLEPVPPAAPTVIVHGTDDDHVPITHSRRFAETFPKDVRLIEVSADHDLNDHLDLIWETVETFLVGGSLLPSHLGDA